MRYGAFIFLASAAAFVVNYGDRAFLGKYITLGELAIYSIAALLAEVPRRLSQAVSGRVIFPLYARRPPAESTKNRKNLNKARWLVTAPLFLMAAGFALIGDPLVRFLYDARYEAAGPLLTLTALSFLLPITVQSYLRAPLASGHSARFAAYQITAGVLHLGVLFMLVPTFGVIGAIIAVPLETLILYPVLLIMIRPYKAWDPVHDMVFAAIAVAVVCTVIWLNRDILDPLFAPLLTYIQ